MKKDKPRTKLWNIRKNAGMTRRQLSDISGVSFDTICGYESRGRDIKGAKYITLYLLASALNCKIEDIIE